MSENKREGGSIVRTFLVSLLIISALAVFFALINIQLSVNIIVSSIVFVVVLINSIYSNHIIKQIKSLSDLNDNNYMELTKKVELVNANLKAAGIVKEEKK